MPGEHIDKIVSENLAKLNHVPMSPSKQKTASEQEKALDTEMGKAELGSKIFASIEKSDLTPEEKQEVYQKLVKGAMEHQVKIASNPATLLRANNPTARFITDYMNTYASGYMESIHDAALTEASKVKLPESIKGKDMGTDMFGKVEGATEKEIGELHQAYTGVAKKVIQASEKNLSKLSPEARAFMESAMGPTNGNVQALNMATASTLLLRGASPMMSKSGALLRDNEGTRDVGNLLMGSNVVLQSYANNINRPFSQPLADDKPQNVLVNKLRTEESMNQTGDAYKSIASGTDQVDKFVESLEVEVEEIDEELAVTVEGLKSKVLELDENRIKLAETQKAKYEMNQKLAPFNQKIKGLEEQRDQLKNDPGVFDHIKAFFKHGTKGVQGEIDKLDKKIDVVKEARKDVETGVSMEDRQFGLDRMKHNRAVMSLERLAAEQEVRAGQIDIIDVASSNSVGSKETVQEAGKRVDSLKPLEKVLDGMIEKQEKVMSVREKLGPKAPQQTQSQSKGLKV